jgi:hypothetical protein
MKSSIIVPYEAPHYCSIDPSLFGPRLLPGETAQGLLTVVRIPPQVRTETLEERPYSKEALSQLLYVSLQNCVNVPHSQPSQEK